LFDSSASFFDFFFELSEFFGEAFNMRHATFRFLRSLARFGFLPLSRSVGRSGFACLLLRFALMPK
jgi:hypothetical protein